MENIIIWGSENIYLVNVSLLTRSCQYDTFSSMSKKRRTKKEKMIASLKRQLSNEKNILTEPVSSQKPDNEISLNYQTPAHVNINNINKTAPKEINEPYRKSVQKD